MTEPWVVALTGASGGPYAVRLLELLARHQIPVSLIISPHAWRLLETEVDIGSVGALQEATGGDWSSIELFDPDDRGALPASGSVHHAGMVICPCSMGTLAAVAVGTSRSLIERAADVALKEGRRLIVVPRETPLSLVHLRNMTALAEAGATILPAAPGFYHRPNDVGQLVDFIVQRVLDQMKIDIRIVDRWAG